MQQRRMKAIDPRGQTQCRRYGISDARATLFSLRCVGSANIVCFMVRTVGVAPAINPLLRLVCCATMDLWTVTFGKGVKRAGLSRFRVIILCFRCTKRPALQASWHTRAI